jgi:hypothetical protein
MYKQRSLETTRATQGFQEVTSCFTTELHGTKTTHLSQECACVGNQPKVSQCTCKLAARPSRVCQLLECAVPQRAASWRVSERFQPWELFRRHTCSRGYAGSRACGAASVGGGAVCNSQMRQGASMG